MNPFPTFKVSLPQNHSRTNTSQQHSRPFITPERPNTPFKGLQLSTSQNFFAQRSQNKRKSTKMTIISAEHSQIMPVQNIQNLPIDLLLKAMNRSTIRAISDGENINIADLLLDYGFAESQKQMKSMRLRDAQLLQYVQRQYIVQLDQKFRQKCSIFNGNSCSKNQTSNTITTDKQHDLRFFVLKFNFQGNQIMLTSLQDANETYYLNFDLLRVLKIDPDNPEHKSSIFTLYIDGLLTLNMYFTQKASLYCLNTHRSNCGNMKNCYLTKKKLEKCFQKIIQKCRSTQLGIFSPILSSDQEFYNKSYATEQQFAKFCQTGDILLFKDNHTMAKVQRAITRSQYDHVAVVIKMDRLKICIFQSSSGSGVAMASWNHLIRYKWYQNIEKISWRRLDIKRTFQFQDIVQKFIGQNLGRQFGLTIPKLLRFQSVLVKDPQEEKKRTYFCTELVATLYKRLGLLQQQKSATQYWPKDFMDSGNIKLLKGNLEKEKQLIFQPRILQECYPFLKK